MKLLRTKYWCFSAIWWGGLKKTAVQALLLVDCFPEWHVLVQAGTIPPTLADARRNVGMCAGANSQVCTSDYQESEDMIRKFMPGSSPHRCSSTPTDQRNCRCHRSSRPPVSLDRGPVVGAGVLRATYPVVLVRWVPECYSPGSPGPTFSRGRAIEKHA